MKFKENAIKPSMVIHCPKEEDARVLLEYLESLGYVWCNGANICAAYSRWHEHCDRTGYQILGDRKGKITNGDVDSYLCKITEFSDLIEPDNSPMSAAAVLEWLGKHYSSGAYKEVFGCDYKLAKLLRPEFSSFTAQEIVDKITAYEAAKKAPKPVEVEWVKMFRIIQIQDSGYKKCVYEEEVNPYVAHGTGEEGNLSFDPKYGAENVLKKYVSEHEGRYIAVIEDVCRVKGE